MKTVLFVPGHREDYKSRNYKSVVKAIENQSYRVKFIPINWKRTTFNDWVKELHVEFAKCDPETTILTGFSFGAMISLAVAADRNPAELWLLSLSPFFAEDIKQMQKSWLNNIGKRKAKVFKQLSFNKLGRAIDCKTLIFIGELEAKKYPSMLERAQHAHKMIHRNRLITVPSCGHDVAQPNYIESIIAAI